MTAMKTCFQYLPIVPLCLITVLLVGTEPCEAGRRVRPAHPGRAYTPSAVATPRVSAPPAPVAPTAPTAPVAPTPGVGPGGPGRDYVHTLPARYERRVYRNRTYYYWDNRYYYEYVDDGQPIYVEASVEDGEPTVPPRPYLYELPPGSEKRSFGNLSFYYADGEYYYEYSNDGPTIYVPAPVVSGVPKVPPRPYVYSLPDGYSVRSLGGVNYYYYLGLYYYVYYINGRAVYVLATVVNGVPSVPPPPY